MVHPRPHLSLTFLGFILYGPSFALTSSNLLLDLLLHPLVRASNPLIRFQVTFCSSPITQPPSNKNSSFFLGGGEVILLLPLHFTGLYNCVSLGISYEHCFSMFMLYLLVASFVNDLLCIFHINYFLIIIILILIITFLSKCKGLGPFRKLLVILTRQHRYMLGCLACLVPKAKHSHHKHFLISQQASFLHYVWLKFKGQCPCLNVM